MLRLLRQTRQGSLALSASEMATLPPGASQESANCSSRAGLSPIDDMKARSKLGQKTDMMMLWEHIHGENTDAIEDPKEYISKNKRLTLQPLLPPLAHWGSSSNARKPCKSWLKSMALKKSCEILRSSHESPSPLLFERLRLTRQVPVRTWRAQGTFLAFKRRGSKLLALNIHVQPLSHLSCCSNTGPEPFTRPNFLGKGPQEAAWECCGKRSPAGARWHKQPQKL